VARFGLLGGTGFTGRLVLDTLAGAGHAVRLGARRPDDLRRLLPDDLEVDEVRRVDVTVPGDLRGFVDGLDVLLTTVGPFDELGRDVVAAAVEARVPYVDSTGEQSFIRWVEDTWGEPARRAGVPLVPAAGFDYVPGDLLAARACAHVAAPDEVHVAYALPRTSDLVRGLSRGTRRSVARMVGAPLVARVGGRLVEERAAERRRLAWFPRPAGPRHAAAIGGGEPLSVPRHVEGLDTVRTYLAVPSLVAEAMQAGAGLADLLGRRDADGGAVGAWIARALTATPDPTPARRAATRWACVAEAHGTDGVARAWAYGTDIYAFTAQAMVAVAERLVAAGPALAGGVLAPAMVDEPVALLDDLAVRTGLRWSVVPPGE
jgi:short subunit dehydrogenase-like uncharacterized protein